MSHTFRFTEKVTIGGETTSKVNDITADQKVAVDIAAVPIANDQLHALTLDVSQVKACYIWADQDLTLETNNSGAPANTIALKANVPYIWYTNKVDAFKLTTDVTSLYVTNASARNCALNYGIPSRSYGLA